MLRSLTEIGCGIVIGMAIMAAILTASTPAC